MSQFLRGLMYVHTYTYKQKTDFCQFSSSFHFIVDVSRRFVLVTSLLPTVHLERLEMPILNTPEKLAHVIGARRVHAEMRTDAVIIIIFLLNYVSMQLRKIL